MATLDAKTRASLPDSAFAYVDSEGKRRLPIHDESHVRNALARFNQVRFESEDAKERAFRKLLTEAVRYGIAPIGFVASRMREARSGARPHLPQGQVTLMLTDIESSTRLVDRLADAYPPLLEHVRELIRQAVAAANGYEVDARADEFFAVFATAGQALETAVAIQIEIGERSWPAEVKVRIGLHTGAPSRTDTGYVGMPVHVAARVCDAGHGGQILVSGSTKEELGYESLGPTRLEPVGTYLLHGLPEPLELHQAVAPGLIATFPPLRTSNPG
jgi:class 3 adenylate cyclase